MYDERRYRQRDTHMQITQQEGREGKEDGVMGRVLGWPSNEGDTYRRRGKRRADVSYPEAIVSE